jgi:hypothetical protein
MGPTFTGRTENAYLHNAAADVGFHWREHKNTYGDPRSKTIKGRLRRVRKKGELQPVRGITGCV